MPLSRLKPIELSAVGSAPCRGCTWDCTQHCTLLSTPQWVQAALHPALLCVAPSIAPSIALCCTQHCTQHCSVLHPALHPALGGGGSGIPYAPTPNPSAPPKQRLQPRQRFDCWWRRLDMKGSAAAVTHPSFLSLLPPPPPPGAALSVTRRDLRPKCRTPSRGFFAAWGWGGDGGR